MSATNVVNSVDPFSEIPIEIDSCSGIFLINLIIKKCLLLYIILFYLFVK